MLTTLENQGYAFAKVDPPVAHEDPDKHVLNLSFHVVTGPRVQIGEIRFEGLKRVHERLVRRRLLLHTGQPYSAIAVEQARKDLLTLGVFAAVSVRLGGGARHVGARAGHLSDERAAAACRQPQRRILQRSRRQRRRDLERSQRARQRRAAQSVRQGDQSGRHSQHWHRL